MKGYSWSLVALVFVSCLAQFGVDIIAPSLTSIATKLHQPISVIQWSMVVYLLTWSLSQLVYGPWADCVGRRLPLCVGVGLIGVGSLMCALSSSFTWLFWGRTVQGLGAGACSLWRSVFRDCYSGEALSKMGAYLGTAIVFIIPAAPLLGGYLQVHFNWHASFYFMVIYSVLSVLMIVFLLKETGHKSLQKMTCRSVVENYLTVLRHRTFLWSVFCVCMTYGAFFAWFVVGPVIWIRAMHGTSSQFGEISFVVSAIAMLSASYLNGQTVSSWGSDRLLFLGWSLMIVAGFGMCVGYLLFGLTEFTLFGPVALLYFGASLIWPNVYSQAFSPFGHIAGFATAVYAMGQNLGGFFLGGWLAHCSTDSPLYMALLIVVASAAAMLVYFTCCVRLDDKVNQSEMMVASCGH